MGTSDPPGPAAVHPLQVMEYVPAIAEFVQAFGLPCPKAAAVNTIAAIRIKNRSFQVLIEYNS
jgi:hypothetical protein